MKSTLFRVCLCTLAIGVSAPAFAQVPIPIEYLRPLKNSVSVGVRMTGGGAKVKFGNLGSIPALAIPDLADLTKTLASTDPTPRLNYDNGFVDHDRARSEETPVDKVTDVVDVGGGRYQVFPLTEVTAADGTKTYQRALSPTIEGYYYNPAFTRSWGYSHPSQVTGNRVALSVYSVLSNGASIETENKAGAGFEMEFGRVIQRFKKFEWGLKFTAGLSDINAKTSQRIKANLTAVTDTYIMDLAEGASAPVPPYSAPTSEQIPWPGSVDPNNPLVYNRETTVRLSQTPFGSRQTATTINGAEVEGYWQIKGAYYMMKFGPNVRIPVAKKFTLSFGGGGAVAFAGTRFIAEERLIREDASNVIAFEENNQSKFLPGFYADLALEWWLTTRTGFYAGASYEGLGKLERKIRDRTADVKIGSGAVFRFGIITRF